MEGSEKMPDGSHSPPWDRRQSLRRPDITITSAAVLGRDRILVICVSLTIAGMRGEQTGYLIYNPVGHAWDFLPTIRWHGDATDYASKFAAAGIRIGDLADIISELVMTKFGHIRGEVAAIDLACALS